MVESSPIPDMIMSAENHIVSLESRIAEHNKRIDLYLRELKVMENELAGLQDELDLVRDFIGILKGESEDIKDRPTLINAVLEVLKQMKDQETTTSHDLSETLRKDKRQVHRAVDELKKRNVLVFDHEEKLPRGRHTRKHYRINKQALEE